MSVELDPVSFALRALVNEHDHDEHWVVPASYLSAMEVSNGGAGFAFAAM